MRKLDDDGREFEIDDATGLCKSVRVPLSLCDGIPPQRSTMTYDQHVSNHAAALQRYSQLGAQAAGHRPGGANMSDSERQSRNQKIIDQRQRLSNAWRNPSPLPPTTPTGDARPSSNGPRPTSSEQAYQSYVQRLQNAWRTR